MQLLCMRPEMLSGRVRSRLAVVHHLWQHTPAGGAEGRLTCPPAPSAGPEDAYAALC